MPGCMPSFTNGAPSLAPEAAYRRSQASARQRPARIAGPLPAALGRTRGLRIACRPVEGWDWRHLEPPDREPGSVEGHHPGAELVDRGVRLARDPRGVAAGA